MLGRRFAWKCPGLSPDIIFERCEDGRYRPIETFAQTTFVVWPVRRGNDECYRAAIGSKELCYLSRPHATPQLALRECAEWHRNRFAQAAPARASGS
jgi:hypothetical protein